MTINIIAEFCQNHNGDVEILAKMIREAKECGASHAKIQGLYSSELTMRPEFESENQKEGSLLRPYSEEFSRLSKLDLNPETESFFVKQCNKVGIIPMITVFTHNGLERAIKAGFKSFKVASYDCASRELIRRILPNAEELVISTGATLWEDIELTSQLVQERKNKNTKVAFLHARTIYPTPLEKMNLGRMLYLKYLGWEIGLSDHSRPEVDGLIASKVAIHLGANYIERHFTILDRGETKDGPVSINPKELQELKNFSIMDSESRYKYLAKIENLPRVCFENTELEIDPQEALNARYYRGRVASFYDAKQIYAWEEWPS